MRPANATPSVLAACCCLVGAVTAGQAPAEESRTSRPLSISLPEPVALDVAATLRMLDRNGDGRISRREAREMTPLLSGFSRLDANRDGRLDHVELSRASLTPIL